MTIENILSYDSHKFMNGEGVFATACVKKDEKRYIVELIKRKHVTYFELEGIQYLVHNTGHLIAPRFEFVYAA